MRLTRRLTRRLIVDIDSFVSMCMDGADYTQKLVEEGKSFCTHMLQDTGWDIVFEPELLNKKVNYHLMRTLGGKHIFIDRGLIISIEKAIGRLDGMPARESLFQQAQILLKEVTNGTGWNVIFQDKLLDGQCFDYKLLSDDEMEAYEGMTRAHVKIVQGRGMNHFPCEFDNENECCVVFQAKWRGSKNRRRLY